MFPWEQFKYIFGRFCCWHIFLFGGTIGIANSLISIVDLHCTKTLKDAGVALKNTDGLNNLLSNSEYITKYFTAFDTTLVLLAIVILVIGIYYSLVLAIQRMLFYPYNYIKLTIHEGDLYVNYIPISIVDFIDLGDNVVLLEARYW